MSKKQIKKQKRIALAIRKKARRAANIAFVKHAEKVGYAQATTVRGVSVKHNDFLSTYEWRKVRMEALKLYGPVCMCCGASPATGAVMNVDHIKPRALFPQLALDINNLQILCGDCNHGKGNWDMTDWRTEEFSDADRENLSHLKSIL
jgi:hypothetical protein